MKDCCFCSYKWESRVESPKACPRCKRRFDYPNNEERIVNEDILREMLREVEEDE